MPVRNIKAGYSNTTSSFQSCKLSREVKAESSLEMDFLFLIDNNKDVTWFEEQPLEIAYRSDGQPRSYTPDLLVRYGVGGKESFVLYEVKYRDELFKKWKKLKPKFKAALKICRERGWKFKVITEKEIRTPFLKNMEFLVHFSRTLSPVEIPMRDIIHSQLGFLPSSTPDQLLALLFKDQMKRAEAMPILWRLMFEGSIDFDWEKPLSMNSKIWLVKGYSI